MKTIKIDGEMECKKRKRKGDKYIPWEYRGFLIRRIKRRSYTRIWAAINKQGKEVLVDEKLKSLCLKIDKVGDAVEKKPEAGLESNDKGVTITLNPGANNRIKELEACLEEIERVALVSEGVQFYAMVARKGLDGEFNYDGNPKS